MIASLVSIPHADIHLQASELTRGSSYIRPELGLRNEVQCLLLLHLRRTRKSRVVHSSLSRRMADDSLRIDRELRHLRALLLDCAKRAAVPQLRTLARWKSIEVFTVAEC